MTDTNILPVHTVKPVRLYDVHSQFAQVHLRTRAERAVYFTLVAQLADSWSAEEIASLKSLDVETVEAVLDRYADAGVVAVVDIGTAVRYRWRSDMRYLFQAGSSEATMIDPVCGMSTDAGTPHQLEDESGARWLFCSSLCLATFRADPDVMARRRKPSMEGTVRGGVQHPPREGPTDS